jgi:CBS domain containing-hemolysin-like protein
MKELQDNRLSIAMVVDEYGGVCGLITMEDLVEEIVGELRDEFDKEERLYRRMRDGSYILNARIELDKLNEILNTNFGCQYTGWVNSKEVGEDTRTRRSV